MMVDMPKWMEKSFSDYSMNLLEIRLSEHTFQNEDVSRLVYMIQHIYRKQIEEMKKECANGIRLSLRSQLAHLHITILLISPSP